MVIVCAWCKKFVGTTDPMEDSSVTHTMCPTCKQRQEWTDSPTLVVSRERAELAPVLRELLSGSPGIEVIVDRRKKRTGGSRAERRAAGSRPLEADLLLR